MIPRYCSAKCRSDAWLHHQHECGHLDLLHSVGIGHLALRTILMATLPSIKAVQKQVQSGTLPSFTSGSPYSRVLGLQHHLDRLPAEDQFQYTVTAALLTTVLHRHTAFLCPSRALPGILGIRPLGPGMEVEESLLHFVGALLLRHLAQLVTNAHAITELQETEGGEVRQVRLASAIYPAASLLNHSCVPAITNKFSGPVLEIRTVRSIESGKEVTNCYGPHHRRHPHQERQEMLQTQYGFRCTCQACTSPDEKQFFVQFSAPLCRANVNGCSGAVEVKFKGPNAKGGVCLKCGLAQDTDSSWESLAREALEASTEKILSQAERAMASKVHKNHQILQQVTINFPQFTIELNIHSSLVLQVRDQLARCLVEKGDYNGAEKILRHQQIIKIQKLRISNNDLTGPRLQPHA